jgi:hypothetical protein
MLTNHSPTECIIQGCQIIHILTDWENTKTDGPDTQNIEENHDI